MNANSLQNGDFVYDSAGSIRFQKIFEAQTKEATGMITEEDKDTIRRCAKRYNVESVILFGSSTRDDIESNDIDIGVKGIDPRLFFKFYAELFKRLPKPVDLVDLSRKSLFNDLVEETGVRIYG
jgi:predicted nucleotidyltransferase